jgi:hypothetical protein
MTLTNIPQESRKGPTVKFWRFGGSLHHKTVQQFTVRKWWHTPISFLKFMSFGLLFLIGVSGVLASFPWDDSTVLQRLTIELFVSPHILATIWIFVAAIATWTDAYKLKFDDNGDLILQSVLRRQRVLIRDIKTVLLAKQDDHERGDDALGIRVKFSGSKLRLCCFAERDEFLKALKAANPVIVVKFD